MRLVKEIPHNHYLVQIHEYNGKYLLKITLDQFEQIFKIPVAEIEDLNGFESKLTDAFFSSCLKRFFSMREDLVELMKK
jgi:hypothetical protein